MSARAPRVLVLAGDFRDRDAVRASATGLAGSILTTAPTPSVPG